MTGTLASHDFAALQEALPRVFDGLAHGGHGGAAQMHQTPEAIAPWIAHLIELDAMADLLPAAGVRLTYEELRGIALLRAAQKKFLSEHERCGGCGAVRRRGGFCPRGCKK